VILKVYLSISDRLLWQSVCKAWEYGKWKNIWHLV